MFSYINTLEKNMLVKMFKYFPPFSNYIFDLILYLSLYLYLWANFLGQFWAQIRTKTLDFNIDIISKTNRLLQSMNSEAENFSARSGSRSMTVVRIQQSGDDK